MENKSAEIISFREHKKAKQMAENNAAYEAAQTVARLEDERFLQMLRAFTDDWANGRIAIMRSEFRMSDASVKRAKMHIVKDEEK